MTSYEDDHNIARQPKNSAPRPRPRLDIDINAFFSNTSSTTTTAAPDAFIALARAYQSIQNETTGPLLESIISQLSSEKKEVSGVSQEFLDSLDRVPRKSLKKDDKCPICAERFLEDQYCLAVRLPCHRDHVFDLECIAPWLMLNATCPLDRKELGKRKEIIVQAEDDEEEWDPNYG